MHVTLKMTKEKAIQTLDFANALSLLTASWISGIWSTRSFWEGLISYELQMKQEMQNLNQGNCHLEIRCSYKLKATWKFYTGDSTKICSMFLDFSLQNEGIAKLSRLTWLWLQSFFWGYEAWSNCFPWRALISWASHWKGQTSRQWHAYIFSGGHYQQSHARKSVFSCLRQDHRSHSIELVKQKMKQVHPFHPQNGNWKQTVAAPQLHHLMSP